MKKKYLMICLISIAVVCLIIPFSLAIYSSFTNSNMSMTTAAWDVSLNQTGINNNVNVVTGSSPTSYVLHIVNDSEVDVNYDIVVSNVPTGVQASIDGTSYESPTDGTITFPNAGTIAYSSQGSEVLKTIYFRAAAGTTSVLNRSITIDVIMSQVL